MIVEFTIVPLDKGESLSESVAGVLDIVDRSDLDYRLTPMGTIVEGEWDEVMDLIKKCHMEMREESNRVETSITIDDREDAEDRITEKVKSVEDKLSRRLRK